jgi:uncharacterized protein involved in copper resistance
MYTPKVWQFVGLSAAVLLTPLWVAAQQTQQAQPTQPSQPPQQTQPTQTPADAADTKKADAKKLEKLEEGEPPSLKIGKPEAQHKVTETRDDSGVKEVKVQSGPSTYYVRPNQQVGDALPGDAQSTTNHGVAWKVLEFDLGSKNKKGDATTGQPAPKDGALTDDPKK